MRKNKAPFFSTLPEPFIDYFSKNLKQEKKKYLGAPPFRSMRAKTPHFTLNKASFY